MSAPALPNFTDITHFHKPTPDGWYDLTFYPVLPGVILAYNDIHATVVPAAPSPLFDQCLIVNYCLAGRCEFSVSADNYCYIDSGLSSLSTKMVSGNFYYPSGYYAGCEVYIFPPLFDAQTRMAEELFGFDLAALRAYCMQSMVCTAPQEQMRLWETLYKAMETEELSEVRLRLIEILRYLCIHKPTPQTGSRYLTSTQSLLAKRLEEEITRDLSRHVSVHEVAAALRVGETSLKNYFRWVYGVNVSVYQNTARMKLAAQLLTSTEQSISTIARQCGYVNQGRFAGVFCRYYHVKPLDYRRRARLANAPGDGADPQHISAQLTT